MRAYFRYYDILAKTRSRMKTAFLFSRQNDAGSRTHYFNVVNLVLVQWNLNLTKSLGTGQIRSLNRGFVISSFFFIYFTVTGATEYGLLYRSFRLVEVR